MTTREYKMGLVTVYKVLEDQPLEYVGQFIHEGAAKAWTKKRSGDYTIVPSHTIPKPEPEVYVVEATVRATAAAVRVIPDGDILGAAVIESLATDKTDDNTRPEEETVL
jgi:hypothetical protein